MEEHPCEYLAQSRKRWWRSLCLGAPSCGRLSGGPTSWTGVVDASPDEAAARDVGGPTDLGWTRWTEDLIEVEVETGRAVLFTGGSVLDDGRTGAGWVKATGGDYITHRKMAGLSKGMALADPEILQALSDSAGLVTISTDPMTARHRLVDRRPLWSRPRVRGRPEEHQARAPHRMDQGTCWHPREEAADAEARSGSAEVGPTQPHEYVTAAWARGRKWPRPQMSGERLLSWEKADIRGLIAARQE